MTKFAPSLYRALIEDKKVSDLEALNEINKKYNAPIPNMIKKLFNKPISQTTVVEKDEIEKEIVEFI